MVGLLLQAGVGLAALALLAGLLKEAIPHGAATTATGEGGSLLAVSVLTALCNGALAAAVCAAQLALLLLCLKGVRSAGLAGAVGDRSRRQPDRSSGRVRTRLRMPQAESGFKVAVSQTVSPTHNLGAPRHMPTVKPVPNRAMPTAGTLIACPDKS